MNSFPHYTASIIDDDGKEYKIHFVALFSDKVNAVPLVLLHGWPGILDLYSIVCLIKVAFRVQNPT
jgi:microsomal epoxide hydrolase